MSAGAGVYEKGNTMKTVDEIYQELLAGYRERAGYAPEEGCDLSLRLYAAAAQIQALFLQSDWVLAQSFPQTAEGTYLEHHAEVCGLNRIPAAKAVGTLRFLTEVDLCLCRRLPALEKQKYWSSG